MSKKATQLPLPLSYPDSGNWFIPIKRIKVDERTWALRLGQPVQLGSSYDVSKTTGIGRRILKRLAQLGYIREAKPSPFLSMYYYSEVLAFIDRTTQDPHFWTQVRREAYIKGDKIQDASIL